MTHRPVSAPHHDRRIVALTLLVLVLVVAFVVAPRALAGSPNLDENGLVESMSRAFVVYWNSGGPDFPPDLDALVEHWVRYHLAKAVIAAAALATCLTLGALLRRTAPPPGLGTARQILVAAPKVLVTLLALASLALLAANVQGAVAPLSSLMSMLPVHDPDDALAATLDEIRDQLAHRPDIGARTTPTLEVMIADFARYHLVMAVISVTVTAVLLGLLSASWAAARRRSTPGPRTERAIAPLGALIVSSVVLVVAVANATTAADPVPALSAFFAAR